MNYGLPGGDSQFASQPIGGEDGGEIKNCFVGSGTFK